MEIPWGVVAAIISVSLAFIMRSIQTILRQRKTRKSSIEAIHVELSLYKKLLSEAAIDWEAWRETTNNDPSKTFLLALPDNPSWIKGMNVIELGLPRSTLEALIRFRSDRASLESCLEALNSDRADKASKKSTLFMIDLAQTWQEKTKNSCDKVIILFKKLDS